MTRDFLLVLELYHFFCHIVGGVISPLLMNIALHGIETAIQGAFSYKESVPQVIRYADDLVRDFREVNRPRYGILR